MQIRVTAREVLTENTASGVLRHVGLIVTTWIDGTDDGETILLLKQYSWETPVPFLEDKPFWLDLRLQYRLAQDPRPRFCDVNIC